MTKSRQYAIGLKEAVSRDLVAQVGRNNARRLTDATGDCVAVIKQKSGLSSIIRPRAVVLIGVHPYSINRLTKFPGGTPQ